MIRCDAPEILEWAAIDPIEPYDYPSMSSAILF